MPILLFDMEHKRTAFYYYLLSLFTVTQKHSEDIYWCKTKLVSALWWTSYVTKHTFFQNDF